MKKYAYYPGCSLESVAVSYDESARKVARALGVDLVELKDWSCCGATAYFNIDELLSYALTARNLALAQKEGLPLVVPCSGCFKNLLFTDYHFRKDGDLREHINSALAEEGLEYTNGVTIYHLLQFFALEIGTETIRQKVVRPLTGLRVAPYYGCQILRPVKPPAVYDESVERPRFFEALIDAIGATPIDYPVKMRCCGGSLITTHTPTALDMVTRLLTDASARKADVLATACPLCQINLECYQERINRERGLSLYVPVLFFTQVLGLALGIPPRELGIGKEFISAETVLAPYVSHA
ncbi:MAG: CoB--CoM heterodisulfide reductase iron-sulfur subunit B family protein [bacterium JZ-2024 1]